MRRLMLRLGLVIGLTGAAAVSGAPTLAQADAPIEQGWWSVTNPGGLPANPATAFADVPADGLLVQAGPVNPTSPCGCTALAAVIYELSGKETATRLTLKVAPNSGTTPVASLELCSLVNPTLNAEQGGPLGDAPDYDCTRHATASLSSAGSTITFNVGSLVSNGILAVAILPGDSSSRVVLSKPDSSSLPTTVPPPSSGSSAAPTPAGTAAAGSSSSDSGSGPAQPAQPQLPASGPVTTPVPVESPVVAPAPTTTPLAAVPAAATSTTDSASRAVPVLILLAALAAGGALWGWAGRGPAEENAVET